MPLRRRLVDCAMRVCRRDLRRRSTRHTRARRRAGHRRPNIHRGAEPLTCPALSPALSIYLCFLTRVCVRPFDGGAAKSTASSSSSPPPSFLSTTAAACSRCKLCCVSTRRLRLRLRLGAAWLAVVRKRPPRAGLADCASIPAASIPASKKREWAGAKRSRAAAAGQRYDRGSMMLRVAQALSATYG